MAKKTDDTIWWKNIVIFAALGAVFTVAMVLEYRADEGTTALHAAAETYGNAPEIVEVLLKAGADMPAKDNEGQITPLYYAARENASEAAEVLRRYGARR